MSHDVAGSTQRHPNTLTDDFLARFDVERAGVLRKRILWYCILVSLLLISSLTGFYVEWHEATPDMQEVLRHRLPIDALYDGLLWILYTTTFVLTLRQTPTRPRLVRRILVLTVLACVLAILFEGWTGHLDPDIVTGKVTQRQAAFWAMYTSLIAVAILVWLAALLVPMRWRESAPVAAAFVVFAAVALPLAAKTDMRQTLAGIACLAVALTGSVAWSNWRYNAFDDRFQSRELRSQLSEVSSELAYARRIHEALFPPPIDAGPVRVRYRYEPMREIGGDFLFVHPQAFPPTTPHDVAPALWVVLIDVAGHGIPAALTVNRLHDELRRFFAGQPHSPSRASTPGALLATLNRFTYESLAAQAMFATALCLRVDHAQRELRYASAGHPPACLLGMTPNEPPRDLASTATMLGVLPPEDFDPDEQTLTLAPGTRIVAFTDGAYEATDAAGTPFGLPRTRELLQASTTDAATQLAKAVTTFRAARAQDDLLVVEIHCVA